MNYWRNPRPEISIDDETAWPKLSSTGHARNHRLNVQQNASRCSTGPEQVKAENPGPSSTVSATAGHCPANNDAENCSSSATRPRNNFVRKSRRSDKICINLQEALENAKNSSKNQMKRAVNADAYHCRLQVTQSKLNNSRPEVRKKITKTYVIKVKKLSKLKKVILSERDNRRCAKTLTSHEKYNDQNVQPPAVDVSSLNLDALKIKADPKLDVDYVRLLSTLSIYSKEHRSPKGCEVPESSVQFKPSLTNKLRSLSINNTDEESSDAQVQQPHVHRDVLDSDIIEKTLSLEINDDTKPNIHDIKPIVQPTIRFTRNFREYCTNVLSLTLGATLEKLLSELQRLQRRLYERDCIKGKYKRRYYSGLKETQKHVELKKVKFVVIAPDLERVNLPGGLDEQVCKLLDVCRKYGVPVCFGLRRRKLGYYTHGKGFIGCIGVANYSGLEEIYKDVLVELLKARNDFKQLTGETEKIIHLDKLMEDGNLLLSESIAILTRTLASAN